MRFSEIAGNEEVKKALVHIVDSGRVPHAILFHEDEGGGALALIQAFLGYLNCKHRHDGEAGGQCPCCQQISRYSHPDVHYSYPITSGGKVSGEAKNLIADDFIPYWRELVSANPYFLENELTAAFGIEKKSGLISIAEAKNILQKVSLATVTDSYRAIVIWLPEKMNAPAANALLKEIEEPNPRTIFLMVTHSPEDVMTTIASRCLRIRVLPAPSGEIARVLEQEFHTGQEEAERTAQYAGGSVGQALFMLSDKYLSSGTFDLFADLMDRLVRRDFEGTLQIGEELAGLESREKQKAFCNFAGECVRKIFLVQQHLDDLAGIAPEEKAFYEKMASSVKKSFSRKSMMFLDRASMLVERNVNQKIVFCNLVSRMFTAI